MTNTKLTAQIRYAVMLAALLSPQSLMAAGICEASAAHAAAASGVPADVLLAITLTETGRMEGGVLRPWPWAVNVAGQGHWFDSAQQATDFAAEIQAQGTTNFDVGCFQLNFRWHGAAFSSVDAMIDPAENARYAAGFLNELYVQHGDWAAAVGAYHSATPENAERYRIRFDSILAGLSDAPLILPRQVASLAFRENLFPLLNGGAGSAGSLVPLQTGGRRLIGN